MTRIQLSSISGGIKGNHGFTMVEVLVVIIIIAILATFTIPGFTRWLPNYRLKAAARDFYSNLQLAKSSAIRDRANCVVTFSGNSYTLTNGGSEAPPPRTVNLADYGSGVSFSGGSSASDIVFNPMGMTTNEEAVSVMMTNIRNTVCTIEVFPSGAAVMTK